jgi:hypothetical protein
MPADISAGGAGKQQTKKNERFPERRKPDDEHRPSRIGLDEGKDLSSKIIHQKAGVVQTVALLSAVSRSDGADVRRFMKQILLGCLAQ